MIIISAPAQQSHNPFTEYNHFQDDFASVHNQKQKRSSIISSAIERETTHVRSICCQADDFMLL